MIILTKEEADEIRAQQTGFHRLDPLPLKNGKFFLPERVLEDKEHERFKNSLSKKPKREITDDEIEDSNFDD